MRRVTLLIVIILWLVLLGVLFVAPASAQDVGGPEARGQFGRVGIGGQTASPLTVIDRNPKAATLSVYRFHGGTSGEHEIGSRFYCHEDEAATGSSYCVSAEVESNATAHSIGRVALNLKARRTVGAAGRVSALHLAVNDHSGLPAYDPDGPYAQGIVLVESGGEFYGPDYYGQTPLGMRQMWRCAAKGDGETGTCWAAITGSRWPNAVMNNAFYALEVGGRGTINTGFRCGITGTCLVIERAGFGIDLNGSDVILRRRADGTPETLFVELARLRAQIAALNARVVRLTAEAQ